MTTKRVTSSCNQEGGKGRQLSTWRSQLGRLWAATKDVNTRYERFKPPRSNSRWPGRSLAATTKREEKENDNQHEDCDQEGHKQL